jgi:hypothetical protein
MLSELSGRHHLQARVRMHAVEVLEGGRQLRQDSDCAAAIHVRE